MRIRLTLIAVHNLKARKRRQSAHLAVDGLLASTSEIIQLDFFDSIVRRKGDTSQVACRHRNAAGQHNASRLATKRRGHKLERNGNKIKRKVVFFLEEAMEIGERKHHAKNNSYPANCVHARCPRAK